MDKFPLVNICIPVYYSGPEIPRVLGELIESINQQDYPNITVLASVQSSKDIDGNEAIISSLGKSTRRTRVIESATNGPASNTNSAIELGANNGASYVKIMNHDDLLNNPNAISNMVNLLEDSESRWLASACLHTDKEGQKRERLHIPQWPGEKAMVEGVNRIGCPSVIMFDASLKLECDSNILYAMDCDMWIQLFRQAGLPAININPDVVVRMWGNQLTENLNIPRQLEMDKATMRGKYGYT